MSPRFQVGIDALASGCPEALRGRAVALLAHPASVASDGTHAADLLAAATGARLVSLLGPEHGYFGWGGAGEHILDGVHPFLGLPVHSLYGDHRKPSAEMLHGADTILVDLQDLAVRCYTFVSTLRYVLEFAAAAGVRVVVADRPIPAPGVIDGPMPDGRHDSFVGMIPAPLVYGLTPAESALWLRDTLGLSVDLHVLPMRGYRRLPAHLQTGAPWIPPSPGIRSWFCAYAYPATVFCEALPVLDCDRAGLLPFQSWCAEGLDGAALARELNTRSLPGVRFHPDLRRRADGSMIQGVRLAVNDAAVFAPAAAGVHMLEAVAGQLGREAFWNQPGARPDFFDLLMCSDAPRLALSAGMPARDIVADWAPGIAHYRAAITPHLLYE